MTTTRDAAGGPGRAGDEADTTRFSNPSCDFICGLTLPFAGRNHAPSATSTVRMRPYSVPPTPGISPSHEAELQEQTREVRGLSPEEVWDPPTASCVPPDAKTPTLSADQWV